MRRRSQRERAVRYTDGLSESAPSSTEDVDTAVATPGSLPSVDTVEEAVRAGAKLGRYELVEEVGRGGMGVGGRAHDPQRGRGGALEVLPRGVLAEDATARLVREARAMAQVSHPNVVAVYGVEIDERGGVVLVMEFVVGTTLGAWLSSRERSWSEIVDAFLAAGRGLEAAHARGLLHRDFKPDNVLVGDDARVRVTDFGLARAVETKMTSESGGGAGSGAGPAIESPSRGDELSDQLTAAGTVMGTPPYMSPEQHAGGDLDPRCDQYAFCVALWRALVGTHAFKGGGRALLAAKMKGPPDAPKDHAAPAHVFAALRRGLQPNRDDRWPSLAALLQELGRQRRPRRRAPALVASAVLLASAGAWGWQRMEASRVLSECVAEGEALGELWNDAHAEQIATAFAATGIAYASGTWTKSRPRLDAYAAQWIAAKEGLCTAAHVDRSRSDDAVAAAEDCLGERRERFAALLEQLEDADLGVVGGTTMAVASLPTVAQCGDEAWLRLHSQLPKDPETRRSVSALRARLARVEAEVAAGRFAEALPHGESILEDAAALPWPPLVTEVKWMLGTIHLRLAQYPEAEARLEEAYFEAEAAGRDELALDAVTALVDAVGVSGARLDEGLRWNRLAQSLVDRLAQSQSIAVVSALSAEGNLLHARGEYAASLASHERALEVGEALLGVDHPRLAVVLNNLGSVHAALGQTAEAVAVYERSAAVRELAFGPDHPSVGVSLLNLANIQQSAGAYEEAVAYFGRALAVLEPALGSEHPHVAAVFNNQCVGLRELGEYDQARASCERALKMRETIYGPDHPEVAGTLNNLGSVSLRQRRLEDAQRDYERALQIKEKSLGSDHPKLISSLLNLGSVTRDRGAYPEALRYFERALALCDKALGADHPEAATAYAGIGSVEAAMDAPDRAVAAFERAVAIFDAGEAAPESKLQARLGLARALWDSGGDRERARRLATEARDGFGELGHAGAQGLGDADSWLSAH
jgi:tetratricopeptide (TPR) repeat protein